MTSAALLCCLTLPADNELGETEDARPNVVLVIADDCTFSDLGCYGGQAATPHHDQLCAEGTRFSRCFQAAPMCSPTRHCLYTGLYPVRSGAYPNHTFVKDGTRSIAHYLKEVGYRVALSGKTHINPRGSFPFEYSEDGARTAGKNPAFDAIERLMVESKRAGTPFAAVLCSNEPHGPYTEGDPSAYPPAGLKLPPHFVDTPATRSQFSKYLAEITYFDGQVGRALGLLDVHGLADDTLVIVLSEQGSGFPFAKWTCYDAGVQSGMVVRWPGHVPAGRTSDALVEYVDIVPTVCEAVGADVPEGLDGTSFLPVLRGVSTTHSAYVFGLQTTRGIINGSDHYGIRTVRDKRYRLIRNLTPEERFSNAVFTTPYWVEWNAAAEAGDEHAAEMTKRYAERPEFELYDCEADPWNRINLADDPRLAAVRRRLTAKLSDWMTDQDDRGAETEMDALDRQRTGRKNRGKKPGRPQKRPAAQ